MDPSPEQQRQRLEDRVERIEQVWVSAVACLGAVLLVLGLLLDYVRPDENAADIDEDDPDRDLWGSLLTLGFKLLSADRDDRGAAIFLGVCYVGLLVVALAALALLYVVGRGAASERTPRVMLVVAWLLGLGVLGATPLALAAAGEDADGDPGLGLWFLAAGAALFILLIASRLRDWWDPSRVVRRPSGLRSWAP